MYRSITTMQPISFLETLSNASTWKDELHYWEKIGLLSKIQEFNYSFKFLNEFEVETLKIDIIKTLLQLTPYSIQKEKRIELLSQLFENHPLLLHGVLRVLSFSYRSVVTHVIHKKFNPSYFLGILQDGASKDDIAAYTKAEVAVKFYQNAQWTAATETIRMARELSPKNSSFLNLEGWFWLIRRDSFSNVSRAYEAFKQSYQITLRKENITHFDTEFLEWSAIACYYNQNVEEAFSLSQINFQKHPNELTAVMDHCKFALLSSPNPSYNQVATYFINFLNHQTSYLYWFTLLCMVCDPLLVTLLDKETCFQILSKQTQLNFEDLQSKLNETLNLYRNNVSMIPKSLAMVQQFASANYPSVDALFLLIQNQICTDFHHTIESTKSFEIERIQTEINKMLNEHITPFANLLRQLHYLNFPKIVLDTTFELIQRTTETFEDLLQYHKDLTNYLHTFQELNHSVTAYSTEIQPLNDLVLNSKFEIKQYQKLLKQVKLFWLRQVLYTCVSIVLWFFVIDTWYFQKGLQGTPIFLAFFALGFTMLVEPKKWFKKFKEPKEFKEAIRRLQTEISQARERIQQLETNMHIAVTNLLVS
ncbi:MAG: hypothetical protein N2450_01335 [bacterium]|nr:hypothetical protein [bacterium]